MNKKILIIEDDTALRDMYASRFQIAGFDVLTASDGNEGMQIALTHKPEAILLDILLPRQGGLGVLRNLKSQELTKDIPIVVVTAYDLDEYRIQSQPYADRFFLKSDVRPTDILEEVKYLIQKRS